jgi:hypothetical protein
VRFTGAGSNTLTLQDSSVLNGDAVGSTATGATNKLVLQGTASPTTISVLQLARHAGRPMGAEWQYKRRHATINSGTLVVAILARVTTTQFSLAT